MKWDLLVIANPVWEISWLVEEFPLDSTEPAAPLVRSEDGGGSAANTACALACAGWRVAAVGRVGDDPYGLASVAALEHRGVTPLVDLVPGAATKHNHLYVKRSDRRTAFRAFFPERVVLPWDGRPHDLDDAGCLLLDRLAAASIAWLRERDDPSRYLNILSRNAPGERGLADPRMREALPFLTVLQIPEADEGGAAAMRRAPASPIASLRPPSSSRSREPLDDRSRLHSSIPFDPLSEDDVRSLLAGGIDVLIRTRGASGVIVHAADGEALSLPAADTVLVDPTGAGDAFAAGFLDGLMRAEPLRAAAGRGLDWAARACRHLGARGWLDHEPPERT